MLTRYTQQIKLEEIGTEGQKKLENASVLCIGAGGIGVTLLSYLAGAGVGQLGILDDDLLEETNLHRQVLYQESHIHQTKALVAQMQLQALNSKIKIHAYPFRLALENAEQLISQYDLVADCSDNFYTRYLIHDTCFRLNKPYFYASAYQFKGHYALFYGKENGCFHCVFPSVPKTMKQCQSGGVIGTLPGLLGIIQATELIKWITGAGTLLKNKLLTIDFLSMEFKNYEFIKNEGCFFCVHGKSMEYPEDLCTLVKEPDSFAVTTHEFPDFLKQYPEALLLDVRTHEEHEARNIGGTLIPIDELESRVTELNPSQPILVYCYSGQRSRRAFDLLRGAGFSLVYHLEKGLSKLLAI
jgi:molybdopterin/thiamine biosynthesis adenylyltransferase/rhodanese-related sulfurtransferase